MYTASFDVSGSPWFFGISGEHVGVPMLPFYRLPFGIFQSHHDSSNDTHSESSQMSHVVELVPGGIGACLRDFYPVPT